jgi:hypothetical protein
MKRYVVAHWRGELSLVRSFLVNGLLVLVVLMFALPGLGLVFTSQTFVHVGLGTFIVWEIWVAVGIFRCALRTFRGPRSTLVRAWAHRGVAVVAVALSAGAVYFTIADIQMLLR